ncbi:MAG TPA: outer membrane protein assembly factor BamD, partial [Anaeromyxobacteraceae bacterium]|nr:outer membrane protein assembly factor BamD [Anaeromyxobacteraceae bacterium]
AEESYQAGLEAAKDENFQDATRFFENVRTKYPFSAYAALSELRLADLKYQQGRYVEAAEAYAQFVKLRPAHEERDYAEFRIGLAHLKDAPDDFALFPPAHEKDQRAVEKAVAALRSFVESRPDSKYAPEAKKLLTEAEGRLVSHEWYVAEFYMKRKRWAGAAGRLEALVTKYPGSRREAEALLLLARAYSELDEKLRARNALQQLIVKHPQDPRRPEAERLLATLR